MSTLIDTYTNWKNDDEDMDRIQEAIDNNEVSHLEIINWLESPTNEGVLGSIFGGLTGLALGKRIGKLIAKILGIKNGVLYDILTSRVIAARIGAAFGKKMSGKTTV